MSNSETQPIEVRSLAQWAQTKRDESVARAEAAEEETTQMPVVVLHTTEAPSKLDQLTPARGFIKLNQPRKPAADAEPLELVGVEETLSSDPTTQAKEAQDRHPNLIIWYGLTTKQFWVITPDNVLRPYRKHADMIRGLGETVRSAV